MADKQHDARAEEYDDSSDDEALAAAADAAEEASAKPTGLAAASLLSEEQQHFVKTVVAMPPGTCALLTGGAGVGKSTTVAALREELTKAGLTYVVAATTGLAAATVGGVTLHSALALYPDSLRGYEDAFRRGDVMDKIVAMDALVKRLSKFMLGKIKTIQYLIIDEASMLSPALYDIARAVCVRAHGRSSVPWGGMRVLFVGDFGQLPPVDDGGVNRTSGYRASASAAAPSSGAGLPPILITHAPFLQDVEPQNFFNLTRVFRQDNAVFSGMLNRMRVGAMTDADHAMAQSRVGAKLAIPKPPRIFPHNRTAHAVNTDELVKLSGVPRTFVMHTRRFPRIDGCGRRTRNRATGVTSCPLHPCRDGVCYGAPIAQRYDKEDYPQTEYAKHGLGRVEEQLLRGLRQRIDDVPLKVGAQVILLSNLAPPKYVNGSVGVIVGFTPKFADATAAYHLAVAKAKEEGRDTKGIVPPPQPSPMSALDSPVVASAADRVVRLDMERPIVEFTHKDGSKSRLDVPYVRFDSVNHVNGLATAWTLPLMLGWAITAHKSQSTSMPFLRASLSRVFEMGQTYVVFSRATHLEGVTLDDYSPECVVADPRVVRFYTEPYADFRARVLGGGEAVPAAEGAAALASLARTSKTGAAVEAAAASGAVESDVVAIVVDGKRKLVLKSSLATADGEAAPPPAKKARAQSSNAEKPSAELLASLMAAANGDVEGDDDY